MAKLALDIRLPMPDFELEVRTSIELRGITALFGPSGSGKTTLLRIIAGLETGAHGKVIYDGQSWQQGRHVLPTHRRHVGMVFQDARLFGHLPVAGNLRYAHRRAARNGIDFDRVVDNFGLGPLLARDVRTLSGGERQRVAIARSLLAGPQLLLMDEPLAAVDRQRRAELLPYLQSVPERFGTPLIYVTHAIEEAALLASRMLVLAKGRLVAEGNTTAMLERLELTSLTGHPESGVLVHTTVVEQFESDALTQVELAGQALTLPAVNQAVGSELGLRIRARDVAIAVEPPARISIRNQLKATITEILSKPDSAHAEVLLDLGGCHLRARLTQASVRELGLQPGMPVIALVKSVALDGNPLSEDL